MNTSEDLAIHGRLILVTGGARSGKSTYAERIVHRLAEPQGGRVTYIATSQTYDEEMAQRVRAHKSSRPAEWETVECPLDVPAAVRAAARSERASASGSMRAAARSERAAASGYAPAAAAGPGAASGPARVDRPSIVLLDCVTLWVANLLFSDGAFGGSEPPEHGYNYDKDLLPAAEEEAAAARVTAAVDGLIAAVAETGVTLVAVTNEVGLGVVPEYPLARLYRDQLGWANQRLARDADSVYLLVSGYALDVKALAVDAPLAPVTADAFSAPPASSAQASGPSAADIPFSSPKEQP